MMNWDLSKQRLGDLLVELGHITEHQLGRALGEPRRCGERIGQTLMRLGFIDRRQLALALTRQYLRALFGALGMTIMALHPELASAAVARAQLGVSATIAGAAAANLRLVGAAQDKIAVTLACSDGLRAQIGVESGRFVPGATAAAPDYVQTWKSAMLKTLTCGADPRSVNVAIAGAGSDGSTTDGIRAVNVTIDY